MKIAWFTGDIWPNGEFTLYHDFLCNYLPPDPSWRHRVYLVAPTWDRGLVTHLKNRYLDVRACFEDFQPDTDTWWKKLKDDTKDCDVIISSNITNLDEVIPDDIEIPVVSLSTAEKGYKTTSGQYGSFYKPRFHKAAISKTAVEAFPSHVRDEVTVVGTGIDPSRLRQKIQRYEIREGWFPGRSQDLKLMLFIGAHRESKGLVKTIKALEYLPKHWHLLVLTPPKDLKVPDHLSSRVHIGQMTYTIADVYLGCDCFVLPTEHEGLSRSLLECWYLKVPVVTTKHKAMLELVAKHPEVNFGNLIDVDADEKTLALAIEESKADDSAEQTVLQHYLATNMVESWSSYLEKVTTELKTR